MPTSDDVRRRLKSVARRALVAGSTRADEVARRHHWLPPVEPLAPARTPTPEPTGPVEPVTSPPSPPSPPALDFNGMLHLLRGVELRRMPHPGSVMVSAGCSDRGYFDWVTSCVGPVPRHIGIELYLPEPDDLPEGVEWVKNSVGDMSAVADASADLLFSGQNFEHLFHDDAPRFLLESHRVLRTGGHLVIDSPNRDVVDRTRWIHPEHTIEFTPQEARRLVELAGFEVTSLRGVWHCADPVTGADLELWPWDGEPPWDGVLTRAALGADDPDHSFVWWLEARRTDRAPDPEALTALHASIQASAWPARLQRLDHHVGRLETGDEGPVVSAATGEAGALMFGPYAPFAPGHYTVRWTVRRTEEPGVAPLTGDAVLLRVDACDVTGSVFAGRDVTVADLPAGEWREVEVTFDVETLAWGGQVRVVGTGLAPVEARYVADVATT